MKDLLSLHRGGGEGGGRGEDEADSDEHTSGSRKLAQADIGREDLMGAIGEWIYGQNVSNARFLGLNTQWASTTQGSTHMENSSTTQP